MVVIEQEPEPEVTQNKGKKKVDRSEASTSTDNDAASDGFETASEGGVDSDEDDAHNDDGGDNPQERGGEAHPETHSPPESVPLTTEPSTANPLDDASIQVVVYVRFQFSYVFQIDARVWSLLLLSPCVYSDSGLIWYLSSCQFATVFGSLFRSKVG